MSSPTASFLGARDQLFASSNASLPVLESFNWVSDYFEPMARNSAATGLIVTRDDGPDVRLSFADLARRSGQVANWLRSLGAARTDRVLLMTANIVPLWEVMLAAIRMGAVIVPATTLLQPEELQDRIDRGKIKVVVTEARYTDRFAATGSDLVRISADGPVPGWHNYRDSTSAPEDYRADRPTGAHEPLLLYFTSGTTSRPKLVEHTHSSYPIGHLSTMHWLGCKPEDVHLNLSSPGWAKHAWSSFFAPWNAGATLLVYNYERFNAPLLLAQLERHQVTTFCAPPTVWRSIVQCDLRRPKLSLREAVSAGEPLNPEIISAIREAWGLTVRDGYGQTETTAQIGNPPGQRLKPGSMGRPLPGYRVVLLDANDQPAREGEICLDLSTRPTGLMSGYRDDAALTAQAMRGGYYHTGDVAACDEEGYYFYIGRLDDVFKSSDYRISPFELESVLIEHEAVVEAAVVQSPDPLRLSVPKAFITLVSGVSPSRQTATSILEHVRRRVAPFKRIRRIEFCDLPKTVSGKIRRNELRQRECERVASGVAVDGEFGESDLLPAKEGPE